MTLNQIAEDAAYKLGDQFNSTLRESIKHTLIFYRAKYLRDDINRNDKVAPELYQTMILPMETVNKLVDVGVSIECITQDGECFAIIDNVKYKISKSKIRLPKVVRLKGYSGLPYRYIGSTDRSKRFSYCEPADLKFKALLPYQKGNQIFYFISDNYLYLLNTLDICDVLIDAIFINPRETCTGDSFADDKEFPIPEDMLVSIIDNIVTKTYPLRGQDGQVVNIQKDDKDTNNV